MLFLRPHAACRRSRLGPGRSVSHPEGHCTDTAPRACGPHQRRRQGSGLDGRRRVTRVFLQVFWRGGDKRFRLDFAGEDDCGRAADHDGGGRRHAATRVSTHRGRPEGNIEVFFPFWIVEGSYLNQSLKEKLLTSAGWPDVFHICFIYLPLFDITENGRIQGTSSHKT